MMSPIKVLDCSRASENKMKIIKPLRRPVGAPANSGGQSPLSFLMPPMQRAKARYFNVDSLERVGNQGAGISTASGFLAD